MLKEHTTSGLLTPYDYYLADLFHEIEEAGCCNAPETRKKLTWVGTHGVKASNKEAIAPKPTSIEAISFSDLMQPQAPPPPPYPPVFSALPTDVVKNIERAVQIYCQHIRPIRITDIQARTSELHEMAYDVSEGKAFELYTSSVIKLSQEAREQVIAELKAKAAQSIPTVILEPFGEEVEKHLNAAVLECRGKSKKKEYHIDFFLLALMRLGMLKRDISDSVKVASHSYEIERSLNRGFSDCREQETALGAYKKRQNEEENIRSALAAKAVKVRHEENSKHARQYTEVRFLEMVRTKAEKNEDLSRISRQIAFNIHSELTKRYPRDEFESENKDSELREKGWLFPKDRERFYASWVLPKSKKWIEQAVA